MSAPAAGARRDEGRVLVLVVGCVVVLAVLVAVVVDSARLYLARRALDAVTDGAALAGAQAADLDAVYAGRAEVDVPLDPAAARRSVDAYLRAAAAGDLPSGFTVDAADVNAAAVTVRTHATVRLPFVGGFTGGRAVVVLRSRATARNHLSGPAGP